MLQGIVHSQVYKTKEYSQFILDSEYNRDVNNNHVKKVKESIKKFGDFGECFPIVVDEKGRIVDGQHRFTARKELGLTIYYIQSTELDSTKLGGINDAIAKWKPESFMKVAVKSPFVKLLKEEYVPNLPPKYFSIGILLRVFGVNKSLLITGNEETMTYRRMVIVKDIFIDYAWTIYNNIVDLDTSSASGLHLKIVMKLIKRGVPKTEIIKGNTLNECYNYLKSKNLIR